MKEPPKQGELPFDDPGSDGDLFPQEPTFKYFPVDSSTPVEQEPGVEMSLKFPEPFKPEKNWTPDESGSDGSDGLNLSDQIEDYPFPGPAFSEVLDGDRLRGQLKVIFDLMKDGCWRTLKGIENVTGFPQASISASLRAFRRKALGRQTLNRERVERDGKETGTFKYQLILNKKQDANSQRT